MTTKDVSAGLIIKIITIVLILAVALKIIASYYNKVLDEKDRLEAKQIENAVSLVLAKYEGNNLTYKNGRIFWTKKNADIIKEGIVEHLFLDKDEFPIPKEEGYYYYMYLESPYTVIKLPYRLDGFAYIDTGIVTKDYIAKKYPKNEYQQVDDEVPYLKVEYEEDYYYYDPDSTVEEKSKNSIVCLNVQRGQ